MSTFWECVYDCDVTDSGHFPYRHLTVFKDLKPSFLCRRLYIRYIYCYIGSMNSLLYTFMYCSSIYERNVAKRKEKESSYIIQGEEQPRRVRLYIVCVLRSSSSSLEINVSSHRRPFVCHVLFSPFSCWAPTMYGRKN
jgi:hypothetical protein